VLPYFPQRLRLCRSYPRPIWETVVILATGEVFSSVLKSLVKANPLRKRASLDVNAVCLLQCSFGLVSDPK
jgi:hypothetical protein